MPGSQDVWSLVNIECCPNQLVRINLSIRDPCCMNPIVRIDAVRIKVNLHPWEVLRLCHSYLRRIRVRICSSTTIVALIEEILIR